MIIIEISDQQINQQFVKNYERVDLHKTEFQKNKNSNNQTNKNVSLKMYNSDDDKIKQRLITMTKRRDDM